MIRRISTKWVLTVLAAVVLPFIGFAWYVNTKMSQRTWDMVRYYLLTIAGDLRDRIDNEIRERRLDVEVWAEDPVVEWALGGDEGAQDFRGMLGRSFDRFMQKSGVFDLLMVVDARGRVVAASTRGPGGERFPGDVGASLAARDCTREAWFQEALQGRVALVDQHVSDLVPAKNPMQGKRPENYHIGFAVPVRGDAQEILGVVYALMNWSHIQHDLLVPTRLGSFEDAVARDIYSSSYAWLWKEDCDTILGHIDHDLYGRRVSQAPIALPQLVEAARSAVWGMYPEYTFRGQRKNAAFAKTAGRERGGFGWVVGVGIDNEDIYATVDELRGVLLAATLSVLGVVVVGTVLIARRTTRPIRELHQQTERVARGDLDTQIEVASRDELGALAQAFNRMTRELSESRARLIKAEKDAAWREMARQVAHEIKNPLTPIALSVDLLKRARDEHSPEFDRIFDRTIDMMQRQVESMRAIASDFSAFAGAHKPVPERVEVGALADEVLDVTAAWARELGVRVVRGGPGGLVHVDRGELRRVLINIVSNALEAMPDGGDLAVDVGRAAGSGPPRIRIEVKDSGAGLSEEARRRLFEPYFTTRTHGTGLGLAIARRLVEEMNGTIELLPGEKGGTVARIDIPERGEAIDDAARKPPAS